MQRNNFLYNLLSHHFIYSTLQKVMSATTFRKKILNNFIKKKNSCVLDIGCGPAEILQDFKNLNYYGFDVNSNYINHAKKKYKGNFFCKKFEIKHIKKKKFDYVLMLGLIHHLSSKETDHLLVQIKKILKKNGKLLTLDNVLLKKQNLIAKTLIKLDRGKHVRNKNEYVELLKKRFKFIKLKIYNQKFIPYTYIVSHCSI